MALAWQNILHDQVQTNTLIMVVQLYTLLQQLHEDNSTTVACYCTTVLDISMMVAIYRTTVTDGCMTKHTACSQKSVHNPSQM